jgi:hypothetical protein
MEVAQCPVMSQIPLAHPGASPGQRPPVQSYGAPHSAPSGSSATHRLVVDAQSSLRHCELDVHGAPFAPHGAHVPVDVQ